MAEVKRQIRKNEGTIASPASNNNKQGSYNMGVSGLRDRTQHIHKDSGGTDHIFITKDEIEDLIALGIPVTNANVFIIPTSNDNFIELLEALPEYNIWATNDLTGETYVIDIVSNKNIYSSSNTSLNFANANLSWNWPASGANDIHISFYTDVNDTAGNQDHTGGFNASPEYRVRFKGISFPVVDSSVAGTDVKTQFETNYAVADIADSDNLLNLWSKQNTLGYKNKSTAVVQVEDVEVIAVNSDGNISYNGAIIPTGLHPSYNYIFKHDSCVFNGISIYIVFECDNCYRLSGGLFDFMNVSVGATITVETNGTSIKYNIPSSVGNGFDYTDFETELTDENGNKSYGGVTIPAGIANHTNLTQTFWPKGKVLITADSGGDPITYVGYNIYASAYSGEVTEWKAISNNICLLEEIPIGGGTRINRSTRGSITADAVVSWDILGELSTAGLNRNQYSGDSVYSYNYEFSTSTSTPPSSKQLRFDNGTQDSSINLYLADVDYNSSNNAVVLLIAVDVDYLITMSNMHRSKVKTFDAVNGVSDQTGYTQITGGSILNSIGGDFSNGEFIRIEITPR